MSHIDCLKRPITYRRKRYAIRLAQGTATTHETNVVQRNVIFDSYDNPSSKLGWWPATVHKLHATKGWRHSHELVKLEK